MNRRNFLASAAAFIGGLFYRATADAVVEPLPPELTLDLFGVTSTPVKTSVCPNELLQRVLLLKPKADATHWQVQIDRIDAPALRPVPRDIFTHVSPEVVSVSHVAELDSRAVWFCLPPADFPLPAPFPAALASVEMTPFEYVVYFRTDSGLQRVDLPGIVSRPAALPRIPPQFSIPTPSEPATPEAVAAWRQLWVEQFGPFPACAS